MTFSRIHSSKVKPIPSWLIRLLINRIDYISRLPGNVNIFIVVNYDIGELDLTFKIFK